MIRMFGRKNFVSRLLDAFDTMWNMLVSSEEEGEGEWKVGELLRMSGDGYREEML